MRFSDRLIVQIDAFIKSRFDAEVEHGPYPGDDHPESALSERERRHVAGLMRVNHAGEVAAQGLYDGQGLVARDERVRETLTRAAHEERTHLDWCRRRLDELDASPSRLDAVWYAGSFAIGALASVRSDAANLGFVAETERQVVEHLEGHLRELPPQDTRTRAILEKMTAEEAHHGETALREGGVRPRWPLRLAMRLMSRVMTRTAYRV